MPDEVTDDEVRATINALGVAWQNWSDDPTAHDWGEVWELIGRRDGWTDLVLDVTVNMAHLAIHKEADEAGDAAHPNDGETWAVHIGDEAPPHHKVLGPLMAAAGNGDWEAAADVVLGTADPSNDWLLKTIGELLVILTGKPGPPEFFDLSFVEA